MNLISHEFFSKRRNLFLFFLAGILLIAMLNCVGCSSWDAPHVDKPSPVDTSILKPLANCPMYDLDELKARFDMIRDANRGLQYISDGVWDGDAGQVWQYEFGIADEHSSKIANVHVGIYDSSKHAKNVIEGESDYGLYQVNSKVVTLSDNIDFTLRPVFRYRNTENHITYDYPASLITQVRIDNIVLDFTERSDDLKTIGGLTNQSLKQICQALKE
ncbi:MAG: hypothetical protein FWF45_01380 [Coriobacteriia bacterium]|nr:hypothetical protein [Coriobacteriia bacterium]